MKNGFTLVELSIVLVIIGLLIGGILVGQSMIESARAQAAVSQIEQLDVAVNQFTQKFRFPPGDAALTYPVYMGGKNGLITDDDSALNDHRMNTTSGSENRVFWFDITKAGYFIAKNCPDLATKTNANTQAIVLKGSNCNFGGALIGENSAIFVHPYQIRSGSVDGSTTNGNAFYIGESKGGDFSTTNYTGSVKHIDAIAYDQKIDDGLPLTGKVQAFTATNANLLNRYWMVKATSYDISSSTPLILVKKIESYK